MKFLWTCSLQAPVDVKNSIFEVGAVTHVLVNQPDTGYGIYIEKMPRKFHFTK